MKVLVTGSSGWLGRHLVAMLKASGHDPVGFDIAPGEGTDVTGSVADRDLLNRLFESDRFDGVIHAAALHKPDIARYKPQLFIDVNITGTLNLLELAAQHGVGSFVFTSTTSLMISQAIREETSNRAVWLDETVGPHAPRNIYGVTKLAAEGLCRQHHLNSGLPVIILRTARFFPEEDDTHRALSGPNMKANELLNRRATVADMCRAHICALQKAQSQGFGLYIVSAPTPFERSDVEPLKSDAASVINRIYPDAGRLYQRAGWSLPTSLGRVYDGRLISRELGFAYETDFQSVLTALEARTDLPFIHDSGYSSPAIGYLPPK